MPKMREWSHLMPMKSVSLTRAELKKADAVIVVTDHAAVDYKLVGKEAKLVVDTRGILGKARNVVKA